jgi:hypothetical protein
MNESLAIVLTALLVIAFIVGAAVFRSRRRQRRVELRERFGPEYENAVDEFGDVNRAERELRRRQGHVRKLDIHPLSPDQYERYSAAWAATQRQFVDDPISAIKTADTLIKDVMHARGYPVADFDQRVADISVDHPHVVQHYRAARALATSNEQGQPSTEDLRQAMIHFRALFQDMLEVDVTPELEQRLEEARA